MNDSKNDLKLRTRAFALRIIQLVKALPKSKIADILGTQLLRSGTSVGANYRSAKRAKSPADFVSKMTIVEEEADETIYWIELLVGAEIVSLHQVSGLLAEAGELVAIAVASVNTAKRRNVPAAKVTIPRSAISVPS